MNNFFHALCSCKCTHFCNISFLGTSTLFERNVYSKVRRITLHFFPLFYPQHLFSNNFNNQNLNPLTLTLIMTPAQALIETSVTFTNSLILDYTLNLLMTLFLWSNYLWIVTTKIQTIFLLVTMYVAGDDEDLIHRRYSWQSQGYWCQSRFVGSNTC